MPAVPVSLFDPVWTQFSVLLPQHPRVDPTHPLGCHRPRISDQVVFEHVVAALVHGSGYERIATPGCSDRTIRRRLHAWAAAGLTDTLHTLVLAQYDHLIGLDFTALVVDGCMTKAPGGGDKGGKSPVDRGKQGLKRSTVTDAAGVPLHLVSAPANVHDTHLLAPTLAGLTKLAALPADLTIHLDRGYDSRRTRATLADLGYQGVITTQHSGPVPLGARWVVERTQAWMNGYGKLRRCTDRRAVVVDFYLFLAATFVIVRLLIQQARETFRWPTRPTTRRLP